MILQGVQNMYETDTLRVVMDKATELTGVRYGAAKDTDVSMRVVADHIRTSVMLIGDGVTPGNEGRGYVLRRIMRRAIRNMRLMGATGPVVQDLVDVVIDTMGQQYPELVTDRKRIETVALAEEAAFLKAVKGGTNILDTAVTETKAMRRHGPLRRQGVPAPRHLGLPDRPHPGDGRRTGPLRGRARLPPPDAGAARPGQGRRQGQEDRPRGHVGLPGDRRQRRMGTEFTGYATNQGESTIVGLLVNGVSAPAASEGDDVEVVLDRTPFYAEGGGQLADQGRIKLDSGAVIVVRDVQQPVPGVSVHKGSVQVGEVTVGASAYAAIDVNRRRAIARAHSATHLTHQALRDALGPTAAQAYPRTRPAASASTSVRRTPSPARSSPTSSRRSTTCSPANST